MEEADIDGKEQAKSPTPEDQDSQDGVSTQDGEEDVINVKDVHKIRLETLEERQKRIFNLQRDLKTFVTNVQIAADARVQRTHQDRAPKIRTHVLKNHLKSSEEKFEQIAKGWARSNPIVVPQRLQEALDSQKEMCDALTEDKKRLKNNLKQDLKLRDRGYVKNLKKNTEDMDLIIERIGDQNKTLIKAYREELAETEKIHKEELKDLLTKESEEWEQDLKELWDKELEKLMERTKKVENNKEIFHNRVLEVTNSVKTQEFNRGARCQEQSRSYQQGADTIMILELKHYQSIQHQKLLTATISKNEEMFHRLEEEKKIKEKECLAEERIFTKHTHMLSEDCKHHNQKYKRTHKKMKHFANVDVRNFEKIWLMTEEEVKQLLERVLAIDSLIYKRYFGLPWQSPIVPSFELFGPKEPEKQGARQPYETEKSNPETDTDHPLNEIYKAGEAAQPKSGPEWEKGKMFSEGLKKVMGLLADEADFLIEDEVLRILSKLEKEEQTAVKLGSLFRSLGISDEDIPKLVDFLSKYEEQQREQTEDPCFECSRSAEGTETNPMTNSASDLIHPNNILPALKSFLEKHRNSRNSTAQELSSFLNALTRDTSEDKAYWESLGNIISENKIKLWDATEKTLMQYHAILSEISELIPEN